MFRSKNFFLQRVFVFRRVEIKTACFYRCSLCAHFAYLAVCVLFWLSTTTLKSSRAGRTNEEIETIEVTER